MRCLLLSVIALSILPNLALADVYKCKDSSGVASFSDQPCSANSAGEKPLNRVEKNNQPTSSNIQKNGSYTKDIPTLVPSDAATQSCFNYVNTTEHFPDPSTTKLLFSTKKWVSVKDVGARQMVNIEMTSKNEAGMYVGKQSYGCLLMGDGVTINKRPYELL